MAKTIVTFEFEGDVGVGDLPGWCPDEEMDKDELEKEFENRFKKLNSFLDKYNNIQKEYNLKGWPFTNKHGDQQHGLEILFSTKPNYVENRPPITQEMIYPLPHSGPLVNDNYLLEFEMIDELSIPEDRESFFAKFLASDVDNGRGSSFEVEPFETEFYSDLCEFIDFDMCEMRITISYLSGETYNGMITIDEKGIHWDIGDTDYGNDDDYDND